MPEVKWSDYQRTKPPWMGTPSHHQKVLQPGGAFIEVSDFPYEDGVTVQLSAAALLGATSLAVDAIEAPGNGKTTGIIPAGAILNFGQPAAITVTINDAGIAENDTAITIAALPAGGFIPAGSTLTFGTTTPTAVVTTADVVAGATSLPVVALTAGQVATLANAETASFIGQVRLVRVQTAVDADATAIAVDPIPAPMADNTVGTYAGGELNRKPIQDGTLLGRTYAERDAGTGYGPAVVASDDQIFLLAYPITDAMQEPDAELYMHGNVVYENLLPGWEDMTTEEKAKIRALYHCINVA